MTKHFLVLFLIKNTMRAKPFIFLIFIILLFHQTVYSQSWNPKPVAEFRIDYSGIFCQNNLKFSDLSKLTDSCNLNGDSCDEIIKWTWDFSHGEKSNLRNPTHNFPLYGNFPITLKIVTKYGYNDSSKITAMSRGPQPQFKVLSDMIIEVGDTAFFENTSLEPFYSPSWKWDFGDGQVMLSDKREIVWHNYTKPGKYNVCLTEYDNFNGPTRCPAIYPDTALSKKNKITIAVVKPSGIKIQSSSKISIFPNPACDHIFIKGIIKGELLIFDLTGKEILKTEINTSESIDISKLNKGTYFIRCSDGSLVYNGRFVKLL